MSAGSIENPTGQVVVGQMPITLLPTRIGLAVATLELALEQETDYLEAQVTFSLRTDRNPTVHFLADIG